jgi:ubiquinol oxidase
MKEYADLKEEQRRTMETPVMHANFILRVMYLGVDIIFGRKPSLPKFKVIEILARYPYWAWEIGSYAAVTRAYQALSAPPEEQMKTAIRHIDMGRDMQDNEQWHLMLIQDIMDQEGIRPDWVRGVFLPTCMATGYFFITRIMYRLNPASSFAMNARFESHAEHEYMKLVAAHPEWEDRSVESWIFEHYPKQPTMADLFRRIGLDERDHMEDSLEEYERLTGKKLI